MRVLLVGRDNEFSQKRVRALEGVADSCSQGEGDITCGMHLASTRCEEKSSGSKT